MKNIKFIRSIIVLFVIFSSAVLIARPENNNLSEDFKKGLQLSKQGEHEAAIRILEKVIEKEEKYPDAHLAIGVACINVKKTTEAFKYIKKASEIDPENKRALFILARLYEENEEIEKAIDAWERFIELEPEKKYRKNAKRNLKRLREINE
ncbi:MAG: tetratricopeptide repeat protein [Elusimicrobiota bacterium]